MKTVAVICEYNPFHMGHRHQFEEIRHSFGEDAAIIAIMSGSFVQRATPAVLNKFERARMAVDAGASLVLELPFPFSSASAEFFAGAGVTIADALGTVDALSFGSECGSLSQLTDAAEKISQSAFLSYLTAYCKDKAKASIGYPRLLAEAYESYYNKGAGFLTLPNNGLAISYISALKKRGSSILPHTILRKGTPEGGVADGTFAGATYLREQLLAGNFSEFLTHTPNENRARWQELLEAGLTPATIDHLSRGLLAHFRLDTARRSIPAECGGGVLARLRKAASVAASFDDMLTLAATKKYTAARLRRAALFSYFGVMPAAIKSEPLYTQVLAMDQKGRSVLANIRKTATISILTKPADLHKLSAAAREQAALSYRADSVYALCSPTPQAADIFLRTAPYRK